MHHYVEIQSYIVSMILEISFGHTNIDIYIYIFFDAFILENWHQCKFEGGGGHDKVLVCILGIVKYLHRQLSFWSQW